MRSIESEGDTIDQAIENALRALNVTRDQVEIEILTGATRGLLGFGGTLVIVTPNAESQGHRMFESSWRGLEPPRHVHVFSLRALQTCCEKAGLRIRLLRTSEQSAAWIWTSSRAIQEQQNPTNAGVKWGMLLNGLLFQVRERRELRALGNAGEELVAVADCTKSPPE